MFSRKLTSGSTVLLVVTIAALALLAGCSSKSVKDDDATAAGSTITVSASPSSVTVNNTSVVEATVFNGTVPVTNQVVYFTIEPASAGVFTPDSAITDANGVAATVFTASTEGAAVINAQTNFTDGPKSTSTSIAVSQEQQAPQGNVTISLSPTLLLANGADTSTVTITVVDGLGQPVADGTPLVLVAGEKFVDNDENGVWSPGIDSLVFDANGNGTWDAMGQIPSNATTTGGTGTAQVAYVAGNSSGTAYIKVTVGDENIGGFADKSVQIQPNAEVNSIFLQSDAVNLVVKGTGGIETSILEATAYDLWGNPVPEGIELSFIITDGPGGGERLDTLDYGPVVATTNSQGTAMVPIQSGTISGTVRIRAYHNTILSNATQIMVSAGPPAYIVVGTEFCNIDYWDNVGNQVGITAVVSDIYMNPVPNNTAVYFSTDEGTMKSHEERTYDLEGTVHTVWIAGTQVPSADGIVEVYCETSGGNVADTGYFINSHVCDSIAANVPASLPADGQSKAVVFVEGYDVNGNYLIDGTSFKADANFVDADEGAFSDGCNSSYDRVKITSSTLEEDHSLTGGQDDGIGATDVVWYWSGGAMVSYSLNLTTGNAYGPNCDVDGPSTARPGETIFFSVVIKDRFGNPLGDHTIQATAGSGTIGGATQNTNGFGEATGFSFTAGATDSGTVNITFDDLDPRGGVVLYHEVSVE